MCIQGVSMSGVIDKLSTVQKFLQALTWKKIAQFTVFVIIVMLTWAAYENRQSIYNSANQSKIPNSSPVVQKLSRESINQIETTVRRSEIIVGIQIVFVDFQKNTRYVVYTYADSPELNDAYTRFLSGAIAEVALFNEDVTNNKKIINLINGEFVCNPFTDTISSKLIQDASKYVDTMCAGGIPPYYGKFTGFIDVYLSRKPTADEIDQVRTLTKLLGSSIYEQNLK